MNVWFQFFQWDQERCSSLNKYFSHLMSSDVCHTEFQTHNTITAVDIRIKMVGTPIKLCPSLLQCKLHKYDISSFWNYPITPVQSNRTPTTPSAWSLVPGWSMSAGRRSNCRSGTLPDRSDSGNVSWIFLPRFWQSVSEIRVFFYRAHMQSDS